MDGRSPSAPKSDSSRRYSKPPREGARRDPQTRARPAARSNGRETRPNELADRDRAEADRAVIESTDQARADADRVNEGLALRPRDPTEVSIQDRAPDSRDFPGRGREPRPDDTAPLPTVDDRDERTAEALRNIQEARGAADAKFDSATLGDAEKAAQVLRELQAERDDRRGAAEAAARDQRGDDEADAKESAKDERDRRFEIAQRSTRTNVIEFLDITKRSVFDQVL